MGSREGKTGESRENEIEVHTNRVNLTQDCPFSEEQRLPRIDDDVIEIGFPVFTRWEVEQETHDLLGVREIGVR